MKNLLLLAFVAVMFVGCATSPDGTVSIGAFKVLNPNVHNPTDLVSGAGMEPVRVRRQEVYISNLDSTFTAHYIQGTVQPVSYDAYGVPTVTTTAYKQLNVNTRSPDRYVPQIGNDTKRAPGGDSVQGYVPLKPLLVPPVK